MPSFQGSDEIVLQPTTSKSPYTFRLTVCSSEGANDGEIPYGDSLSSCTVKVYDWDGNDKTSEILESDTVDGNDIDVELNYPSSTGAGRYKITFTYTTTNGYTDELDFKWIEAVDL